MSKKIIDNGTVWQTTCETLWGPDWIQPASEVLGITRRTVERWRNNEREMPAEVQTELKKLLPKKLGIEATRAYGDVLRHVARGGTVESALHEIKLRMKAIDRLKANKGKFALIPALAGRAA